MNPISPAIEPEWSRESRHELRTLWFADGSSLTARVTKVEENGIQISSPQKTGFVSAVELCTLDRVHYHFGSRAEDAWVARVNKNATKQKLAHP